MSNAGEFAPPAVDLVRDLVALCQRHGLLGCVFISITADHAGAAACGATEELTRGLEKLGASVLADIAAGRHDPPPQLEGLPPAGRA